MISSAFVTQEQVLACPSLPTLPAVAMQLLEKTSNPDVAISEIAALIQNDPGLASKVLKTVNSSFYGLSKPCPSIDRAIAMLGLRAVKSLVLGFSIVNLTQGAAGSIDLEKFWRHTILAAASARQIAIATGQGEPDEAFAAGLFQDMGVLAILAAAPEPYGQLMGSVGVSHHDLGPLESESLGFDHAQIGVKLAEDWQMPGMIVAAIAGHHAPPETGEHLTMIRTVALGTLAAQTVTAASPGPPLEVLHGKAKAWFAMESHEVHALVDAVTQSSKEIAKLLGQQIGELPDPQEILAAANQRLVQTQIETQREADVFQQQARQFEQAATIDGLTGIPNRKRFDELIDQADREAKTNRTPMSVVFSDADKFKMVNDNYGHHAGDLILQELAQRLADCIGDRGSVCRYGGEEFAIVLPGATLVQAAVVAEEARLAIDTQPFDLRDIPEAPDKLPRTVSLGVASWHPGDGESISGQDIVQRADKAVYLAKESGRNNVKRWGIDLDDKTAASDQASPAAALPSLATVSEEAAFDLSLLEAVPQSNGPTSILLIEDDPLASRLLEAMFRRVDNVKLTAMANGREALEYLREAQRPGNQIPDLILCELTLPGFSGLQIARALKTHHNFCHIPIVVLTSAKEDEQWQACLAAGIEHIYTKESICADLKGWCQRLAKSVCRAA